MKVNPRILWSFLAVSVLLGSLWQWAPLPDSSARLAQLPARAPGVESRDVPLAPAEAVVFHGTSAIKRLVAVQGTRVILTVVDGTRNRHAIHDPAFCFRGAGWHVVSREVIPLERGEARLLRLDKGTDATEAVYWFTDGQRQFTSPVEFWWRTALRRLTFGHGAEEPILVVLTATSQGPPDWPSLLQSWPDLQAL